jgi:hypothetical protein
MESIEKGGYRVIYEDVRDEATRGGGASATKQAHLRWRVPTRERRVSAVACGSDGEVCATAVKSSVYWAMGRTRNRAAQEQQWWSVTSTAGGPRSDSAKRKSPRSSDGSANQPLPPSSNAQSDSLSRRAEGKLAIPVVLWSWHSLSRRTWGQLRLG